MSTFAVTNTDQVLDSVNYLLSNLSTGNATGNISVPDGTLVANATTGEITQYNTGGDVYGYVNQYVNLRYATNSSGTTGFSTVPTNATYFGVYNSSTPTPSSNPAAYVWREVAGGFGLTKTIYYSAIGGRQVLWAAASSPPSSNYVISVDNVAIDLDVVTTATGSPGERGPIAMAYVVTTADPNTATSSQLTSWFEAARDALTPPIGTGLTPPVPGDTATFIYGAGVGTPSGTFSYNGSVWNLVVGQVIDGNVIVDNTLPGNRIAAATIEGSRIAVGTIEGTNIAADTITGNNIYVQSITGDKVAANTITGTNIQAATITSDRIAANTITANNIQAATITGSKIAANTITTTQISTDYLYSGNIVSFGATIGSNTSPGYWLQYNTGNARFGGNVSIGNSLTIGSNASIGGNLSVSGLITSGGLNSNTVATLTVQPGAISNGVGASRNSNVSIGTQPTGGPPTLGYSLTLPITISVTSTSSVVYVYGGASLYAQWSGGGPPSQYFSYKLFRQDPSLLWNQVYSQKSATYSPALAWDNSSIAYFETGLAVGTYTYVWSVTAVSTGSATTTQFYSDYNTIFAQELKR